MNNDGALWGGVMQSVETEYYTLIQQLLGASRGGIQKHFAIYFPNKDKDGRIIEDIELWVNR